MASTILEAFCAVTPLLPQLMTQRVGMVVADREKWVAANSIEELAATVVVGKAVKPEAAVAVAMRERRRVVVQVKKEVYGVPYVAVSIPLEEGGEVVGAVAVHQSLEHQRAMHETAEELRQATEALAKALAMISEKAEIGRASCRERV